MNFKDFAKEKEAYRQGQEAFISNKTLGDNPYPPGTRTHRQWKDGFFDTQEEKESVQ